LHVDDLAVADGEDHEALLVGVARFGPGRGTDDLVTELHELRPDADLTGAFPQLDLQDLPGLVRTASTGCPLPPQMPAGEATPFAVLVEQREERLRVPLVERVDRSPQLV